MHFILTQTGETQGGYVRSHTTAEYQDSRFNVNGVAATTKRNDLIKDMSRYNVDICCLQETKVSGEVVDEELSYKGRGKRESFY